MGLPIPSDMAASSRAANPLAPFMAPPAAAGASGPAHHSAAMPDMPSDINVEEARYCFYLVLRPVASGFAVRYHGQQLSAQGFPC